MSLFDFFFPEQAQATHLRRLADTSSYSRTQQRVAQARTARSTADADKRIKELEDEVAQLAIILESVLEIFSTEGSITRADLAKKIAEIDARDGTIDGRITKPKDAKPKEDSTIKSRFQFPE